MAFSMRRAFVTAAAAASGAGRVTLRTIRAKYEKGTPLTMLTAYDYAGGRHVDESGADMALVGDSLGMVVLGHSNTQQVTLDQMIHHAKAVRRGVKRAFVVVDLPFGSYEADTSMAVSSAIRMVKESGGDAIKIEGNRPETVRAILNSGVPVMGHVGLSPQAVGVMGGFRTVGRCPREAVQVLKDAASLADAGVFGIVLECVPSVVARTITEVVDVPTVGIGAGAQCDGQVLVYHDVLGLGDYSPKFAKRYRECGAQIVDGLKEYCDEVRQRAWPREGLYGIHENEDEWRLFWKLAESMNERKRGKSGGPREDDEDFKLY